KNNNAIKEKKVGILTFHKAINYGAVLQAYALSNTLLEYYSVDILDYECKQISRNNNIETNKLKKIIKCLIYHRMMSDKKKRISKFNEFVRKYLPLSVEYNESNIKLANDKYDAIVVGSDQVWNLRVTGYDMNYYLRFANDDKKYSYAVSFGGSPSVFEGNKKEINKALSSFQALLVREKDAVEYIKKEITATVPKLTCDPVFLLSKDVWIKKMNLVRNNTKKGYIFVYIVAPDEFSINFAMNLAKDHNLDVVVNQLYKGKNAYVKGTISRMDAGPIEFQQLILNAAYVVTTSFHAMAFSLIFNIDFYFELSKDPKSKNSRLINLAEIFSMEDREIKSGQCNPKNIEWNTVNFKIKEYAEGSKTILFDSLKTIK
ncbi:MAG: polysaccharide pyruvyl transferase family protein, partial [Oscillospiraceae bacterium]|nr:polysaccharide pyruvyl transferase family protein [Oscillospiraceae bacterium]